MLHSDEIIIIFGSPHRAMKAEKVLKQAQLPITLIPAPAGIGEGCALAIRLAATSFQAALTTLAVAGMEPSKAFRQTPTGLQPVEKAA
jgi:hypothetical protein